jgi:hypothetical protein
MCFDVDHATNALLLPDRPVLLERACTIDTWLIVAGSLQDVVSAAISSDGSLLLSSRSRVVRPVGLDNVVFNQWVAGPAVQRDVAVNIGSVPGTRVGDVADAAGVPALASDEVADVGPLDIVL